MASGFYTEGWDQLGNGNIDLLTDTIKAAVVNNTYTYSAAHEDYADLSGTVGTDQTLGTKTLADGAFDAADSSWTGLSGTLQGVVIYKDTGTPATSTLLAYLEFSSTTTATAITAQWDASGLYDMS